MKCPVCQLAYRDYSTGLSFRDVRSYLTDAKWITRATVLGRWHEIKQMMWRSHLAECDALEEAPF